MKKSIFAFLTLCACSATDPMQDAGGDDASPQDVFVQDQYAPDVTTTTDAGKDAAPDVATNDDAGDASDAQDDVADAGNDALPPEGTPCTTPNEVQDEPCGLCGTHYRGCLWDGDAGYAWGSWGFCQGEVKNGCDPNGSYADIACGNCGTQKQVCLSNCTFDLTQSCNEPQNACKPGKTNFTLGLSCDGGGREQTCDNQCQWGNYGVCQAGPTLPKIQVPSTVGSINSSVQTFDGNTKLARLLTGTCPESLSSSVTVFNYVVIENSTSYTATVDVYHSIAPNSTYIDTVMTSYPGALPPDDNDATARGKCTTYVDDGCSDTSNTSPPSCSSSWAGLMKKDGRAISIPAGGSVVLYSAAYFTSQGTGDFQINVKTQSLL